MYVRLLILLLLWMYMARETDGGAVLLLKFDQFHNPGGSWLLLGIKVLRCDGTTSECDHQFEICIDKLDGPNSMESCNYSMIRTTQIMNKNHIVFGSTIGRDHNNPLEIPITKWEGGVFIKIYVRDAKPWPIPDLPVDHITAKYTKAMPAKEKDATYERLRIWNHVILDVEVKVYCEETYSGPGCDEWTGNLTCGEGRRCVTNITNCDGITCENDGSCEEGLDDFYCACKRGYTGTHCETPIRDCSDGSCGVTGGVTAEHTAKSETWINVNWWVIVVIVALLISILILVIVFCKRQRNNNHKDMTVIHNRRNEEIVVEKSPDNFNDPPPEYLSVISEECAPGTSTNPTDDHDDCAPGTSSKEADDYETI